MVDPIDRGSSARWSSSLARAASGAQGRAGAAGLLAPDAHAAQEPGPVQAAWRAASFSASSRSSAPCQGLAGLQTSFDGLASSLVSNQALQASALVGRSALAETSTLAVTKGSGSRAPSICRRARRRVSVADSRRDGPNGPHALARRAAGRARVVRMGRARRRRQAGAGRPLHVRARRIRRAPKSVAADTLLRAPIDSVLLGADGFSVELRGIGEVPFTAVREIRNEISSATQAAAGASTD